MAVLAEQQAFNLVQFPILPIGVNNERQDFVIFLIVRSELRILCIAEISFSNKIFVYAAMFCLE